LFPCFKQKTDEKKISGCFYLSRSKVLLPVNEAKLLLKKGVLQEKSQKRKERRELNMKTMYNNFLSSTHQAGLFASSSLPKNQ